MKLFEVLKSDAWDSPGTQAPYLKRHGPKSVRAAAEQLRATEPDHEYVGSGVSAYVGRKDNPHELDRVTRLGPKKDGAGYYLAAVYKAGLHNNPYLPRILARPTTSGNVQTAIVERLIPFETPKIINNRELMMSLWDYWFLIGPNTDVLDATDEEFALEFSNNVSEVLQNGINRQFSLIRDPALVETLKFIIQIQEQHDLTEDIHDANIMWRITGNMPQMVITDPLATFLSDDEQ